MGELREIGQTRSRRKRKSYLEEPHPKRIIEPKAKCDLEVLIPFIDSVMATNRANKKNDGNYAYTYSFVTKTCTMMNNHGKSWNVRAAPTKVKRAVTKLGHVDLNIFVYAQPRRYNPYTGEYETNPNCGTFVLDLDDTGYTSIEELRAGFAKRRVMIPAFISQTGPTNFHIVYMGTRDFWTDKRMESLACQIANIDEIPSCERKLKDMLKEGGVDPNYLYQNRESHKFRIPGSVNHRNDGVFVVKGWLNEDYNKVVPKTPKSEVVEETNNVRNKIGLKIREKSIEIVREEVRAVLGRSSVSHELSELIAMNITLLERGDFAIAQQYFADKWGVNQRSVSRALRKLMDAGVLIESKPYIYWDHEEGKGANRARSYKLGESLIERLNLKRRQEFDYESSKKVLVLKQPYGSGMTNERILRDTRIMYALGFEFDDYLQLVQNKQYDVLPDSRRTEGEIKRVWEIWEDGIESGRWVSSRKLKPPFKISRLVEEI